MTVFFGCIFAIGGAKMFLDSSDIKDVLGGAFICVLGLAMILYGVVNG